MTTTTTTTTRSVRTLLRPDVEQPIGHGHNPERRQHPRFSRCLLGQMTLGTDHIPVACVDVSMGGTQVVTPLQTDAKPGDRVTVNVQHVGDTYRDECTVISTHPINNGMACHLQFIENTTSEATAAATT